MFHVIVGKMLGFSLSNVCDCISSTCNMSFLCEKCNHCFDFNQEAGMQMEKAPAFGTHLPIREEIGFSRTRLVM